MEVLEITTIERKNTVQIMDAMIPIPGINSAPSNNDDK